MVVNGVTWDSKRNVAVYSMPSLMAAYDPAARTWRDLEAKTELHGRTLPGGPPVFGPGMCYDPVNDQIIMFPHFGAQAADRRDLTGRISGHLGTLRFSYNDKTWRRVGETFGSKEVKQQRTAVVEQLGKLTDQFDRLWQQRGDRDAAKLRDLRDRIWELESRLATELAVEPPRRAVAPMVYDPRRKLIVMFGGDSGRIRPDLKNTIADRNKLRAVYDATDRKLNDTWVYDCTTRQWRDISNDNRPPAQRAPMLHYDPHSGRLLLVTIDGDPWNKRVPRRVTLWSLDAATGQWHRHDEQPWAGEIDRLGWYTSALDPKHKLLLLAHSNGATQTTFAFRYDLSKLPGEPAPRWQPATPITPTTIPPDDPEWVGKLESLEANKWVRANPPVEPSRRDWGIISRDPVRGWMVYFGGGHSTYQGTDVAIYQVGANRWVHQAGGHNDSIPPVGWGGYHVDAWGGNNAGHMRNQYVAIDGRMFMNVGFGAQIKPRDQMPSTVQEIVSLPDKPYAWFYDVDRGGLWRQTPATIAVGQMPKPNRGLRPGTPHVVDPRGLIYGINISARRYDNRPRGVALYAYDIYAAKATITKVPKPWPNLWPESRPFCMLPDRGERGQIFLLDYDWRQARGKERPADADLMRFWLYDIAKNSFIQLRPANMPTVGRATGTAYVSDQDCVLAIIDRGGRNFEQWVYSLRHNRWQQLPMQTDSKMSFQAPYTQMDYVEKFGVLFNFDGRTRLMRPAFDKLKWE
jgi:hypothetical protein